MAAVKIADSVYAVGVLNPGLRVFDIVMKTEFGTTYNAYLVVGSDKTALIETCHRTYFEHFVENIESICPIEKIDYVILNHNEPDHSGALAALLEHNPKMTVVASQAGSLYLKNITNRSDIQFKVVKDGETLSLGNKTLRFINAPFLPWPDSMFTWLEEDRILFSCDFLGSHYCEPYMFDYNITYPSKYEAAFKGYYDAIFGPFGSYVLKGLEKIKDLDIDFVCPSHGPIITRGCRLDYVRECYERWSQPIVHETKVIPIFYTSAYGNTRLIAQAIEKGIRSVLPDADTETYDIIDYDMGSLGRMLNQSDAFALGSPTINRDAVPPAWMLLSHVDAIGCAKKPCLVFGSYGWSGEAVPNLTARLNGLKMSVFGEGMKVCFVPSEEDLEKATQLGADFATSLK